MTVIRAPQHPFAEPVGKHIGDSNGSAGPRRRAASEYLLQGARELVILHDGCEYILRVTRQNKLILTK
ncbi:hemin uptake protein HemP [Stutzerimonas kunmingensis]|uniref:Hemin transporter HemP n=1 Tax=Stutzerimonas stutzeri TaxID=316 RepID=A0A023WSB6_STUST|nr:hemin uptake protein HemP [Stutzerimonas decontaminans]AHY42709.1 hemin transporter HemP [Stutzerimonas decontaminans]